MFALVTATGSRILAGLRLGKPKLAIRTLSVAVVDVPHLIQRPSRKCLEQDQNHQCTKLSIIMKAIMLPLTVQYCDLGYRVARLMVRRTYHDTNGLCWTNSRMWLQKCCIFKHVYT